MTALTSFSNFELFIAFSIMPSVFVFLWFLIIGDFKNFPGSRKAYKEYTAQDPVNCYQSYMESRDNK